MYNRYYLEHLLVDHCNLRCSGCSSHSPLFDDKFSDLDQFIIDLQIMSRLVHVKQFRFSGGEPLLHPQLEQFIVAVRESNISDTIAICTNAVALHAVDHNVIALADKVYVSKYVETGINYSRIAEVLDSIKLINSSFTYQIDDKGTSFIDMDIAGDRLQSPQRTFAVFHSCQIAWDWGCASWKNGRLFRCARSQTADRVLTTLHKTVRASNNFWNEDSIPINQYLTSSGVQQYLESKKPLKACSHCNGTRGALAIRGDTPTPIKRYQQTVSEIKFIRNRYENNIL